MSMWAVIACRSSSEMSRLEQLNRRKHGVVRFIDVALPASSTIDRAVLCSDNALDVCSRDFEFDSLLILFGVFHGTSRKISG
jgi:hypothetical protein